MTTLPFRLVTTRDIETLSALDHCPLTAAQLHKFSQTFASPFPNEKRVRERLHLLSDAGRVRRWQYASAGRGAPNYYTLSLLGYRLLHGADAIPLRRRAFDPVGLARQHHTQSLADFIVHTTVAAHRSGAILTSFYRENTLRLSVGEECLYPDSAFQLIEPDGAKYAFFIEIDAGSERIRSPKDVESWERKIRFYEQLQDQSATRFRVLIILTRGSARIAHLLDAAASLMRNPQRSLFYALALPSYLAETDALRSPLFLDHRVQPVSLLPVRQSKRLSPIASPPPPDASSVRYHPHSPAGSLSTDARNATEHTPLSVNSGARITSVRGLS